MQNIGNHGVRMKTEKKEQEISMPWHMHWQCHKETKEIIQYINYYICSS